MNENRGSGQNGCKDIKVLAVTCLVTLRPYTSTAYRDTIGR